MTDAELDTALAEHDAKDLPQPDRRISDADRRRIERWFPKDRRGPYER